MLSQVCPSLQTKSRLSSITVHHLSDVKKFYPDHCVCCRPSNKLPALRLLQDSSHCSTDFRGTSLSTKGGHSQTSEYSPNCVLSAVLGYHLCGKRHLHIKSMLPALPKPALRIWSKSMTLPGLIITRSSTV